MTPEAAVVKLKTPEEPRTSPARPSPADRKGWSDHRKESLPDEFRYHADKWMAETAKLSSTRDIALHPSYQRIMAMGPDVLPFIFREMKEAPDHWFWALQFITGEDPVPAADAGKIRRMTEVWLRWAKDHRLTP
jgi:hypothetical protein